MVEPGRSFTWEQSGPGVRTTARHRLEALPDGGTRVHLAVEQAGWLGVTVGRFYAQAHRPLPGDGVGRAQGPLRGSPD